MTRGYSPLPTTDGASTGSAISPYKQRFAQLLKALHDQPLYHPVKPLFRRSGVELSWLAGRKIQELLANRDQLFTRTLYSYSQPAGPDGMPSPTILPVETGIPEGDELKQVVQQLTELLNFLFRLKYEIFIHPDTRKGTPPIFSVFVQIANEIRKQTGDAVFIPVFDALSKDTKGQLIWLQDTQTDRWSTSFPRAEGAYQNSSLFMPREGYAGVASANSVRAYYNTLLGRQRANYPLKNKVAAMIALGLCITALLVAGAFSAGVMLGIIVLPLLTKALVVGGLGLFAFLAGEFTHRTRQNKTPLVLKPFSLCTSSRRVGVEMTSAAAGAAGPKVGPSPASTPLPVTAAGTSVGATAGASAAATPAPANGSGSRRPARSSRRH